MDVQASEFQLKVSEGKVVEYLDVANLYPLENQPRKYFSQDALKELSSSIKQFGVLQPILVVPNQNGSVGYTIIAGERRWRASSAAGLKQVPCLILKGHHQTDLLEIALIENIQREQLSPLEEAECYKELIQRYGYSHETLSQKLGKSRSSISNILRLLSLPDSVRNDLKDGKISSGHAKILCSVSEDSKVTALSQLVKKRGLSVRQLEELVKKPLTKHKKTPEITQRKEEPNLRYVSDQLKAVLGTKVSITKCSENVKGNIIIEYFDYEDLQRLTEIFLGK